MRQTLHKKEILRGYGAYREVLAQGNVYSGKHIKVFILHTSDKGIDKHQIKVGFAVSRVRSAIIRNRVKRLMREVVRRNKELLYQCCEEASATHFLLMCSSSAHHTTGRPVLSYKEVEDEFRTIMQQLSRHQ